MTHRPRRAAFFDMDKTLLRVNTAGLYARRELREGRARRRDVARLSWWLLRYAFGVLDAEAVARRLVRPWQGSPERDVIDATSHWVASEVLGHLSTLGLAEVERRRAEGWDCVLLTSSTVYAATPVAQAAAIEHVLASRLRVQDGLFTGEVETPFCFGHGKVAVAEAWAAMHAVDLGQSAFFTDSISDMPMLERVGEPVAVNPDLRLRWEARRRGWPVLQW